MLASMLTGWLTPPTHKLVGVAAIVAAVTVAAVRGCVTLAPLLGTIRQSVTEAERMIVRMLVVGGVLIGHLAPAARMCPRVPMALRPGGCWLTMVCPMQASICGLRCNRAPV